MPIEAYIRPLPGRTNFALFPWAAFSSPARSPASSSSRRSSEAQERRLQAGLLVAGLAGIAARLRGIVSSVDLSGGEFLDQLADLLLPPTRHLHGDDADRVRRRSLSRVPAQALRDCLRHPDVPGRVITTLGRSSLFVYWIHVEMAYGGLAKPLKRALPLELSLARDGRAVRAALRDREMEGSQDARTRADWRLENLRAGAEVM